MSKLDDALLRVTAADLTPWLAITQRQVDLGRDDYVAFYVDPAGRLDVRDIHDQVAWWQSQKMVDAAVDAAAILDLGFVDGHRNVPR